MGMREKLKVYENEKITILATYKKYAITNHRRNNLFVNVTDMNNNELTEHCWIKLKKSQEKLLVSKHTYSLKGTITTYYKRGKDGSKEIDYCLSVLGEVLPMLRRYTRR